MLYIVGGAARTGKSIISRKFMADMGIPYFSLDILKMGLANGYPESRINPEDPEFRNAGKMWPILRSMLKNMIEEGTEYIVEGYTILPEQVSVIQSLYFQEIKTCFVGYNRIHPEEKLALMRSNSDFPNNWLTDYSDQYMLEFIRRTIKYSSFLEKECIKYGIPYFDQSEDFIITQKRILEYLYDQDL